MRRLALAQGRIFGGTTPYNMGWLKQEVYDKWRKGDPDYRVIQFASIMNPAFPKAEYQRAKASMAAWKFEMFYNGNFTRPAGMIYGDFDDKIHKISPIAIPPEWPRYVGLDFGPVHTASIWVAQNPITNIYYLYRETLEGGKTTRQHVEAAKERGIGENVISITGGAGSEDQYRMDWGDAGLSVNEPEIKGVDAGIDRVIELLKTKRLFVFDTCKMVLDELGTYARKLDADGQPTEEIADKNKFHLLDALRYDVVGLSTGTIGYDFR